MTLQTSHYSTCRGPFPSLRRRGEARTLDFRSPPRWATIGGLVAGVTKAPPPSLWDHSGAVSGMGRGPEERARCTLGFVVHPPSCSRRAGPLHTENYNPQQPGGEPREGGLASRGCSVWAGYFSVQRRRLGDPGLLSGAAVGGGGGWGGPSGQAGGFPSSLGPAAPRGRWGGRPLGRASPQELPPRPRPAPPARPVLGEERAGPRALPSHLQSRHHHSPGCPSPLRPSP